MRSTRCCSSSPSAWRVALDPADCESERTVIISELQGGENDPDQLLDQELTATAFRLTPIATRRLAGCPICSRCRATISTATTAATTCPTMRRSSSLATSTPTLRCERVPHISIRIAPGESAAPAHSEPEQTGERRVVIAKEGTTAYLKIAYHAPAAVMPRSIRCSCSTPCSPARRASTSGQAFESPPPQRSTRLYRALVDTGLASAVSGATHAHRAAVPLHDLGDRYRRRAARRRRSALVLRSGSGRRDGMTAGGAGKAEAAARARLVFDNDSVTNIAHQLGYFETIAATGLCRCRSPPIDAVTPEPCARRPQHVAEANRTVGWFEPASVRTARWHTCATVAAGLAPPGRFSTTAPSSRPPEESRKTPAVTLNLAIRAGSICDPPGRPAPESALPDNRSGHHHVARRTKSPRSLEAAALPDYRWRRRATCCPSSLPAWPRTSSRS